MCGNCDFMIVLLVGPSGIGKSSTVESLRAEFPDVIFEAMDSLAPKWAAMVSLIRHRDLQRLRRDANDDDLFLSIGIGAIGCLAAENPDKHLVIDVGAGFQCAKSASNLHRLFKVLCLTASPQIVHGRIIKQRSDPRSFETYLKHEFNCDRKKVYDSAHFTVDTSLQTQEETTEVVSDWLRALLIIS